MANIDTPFGFKPVGHLLGASWSGKANVYYVPVGNASALFKGDAVKSQGSADATGKYPTVVIAAAGDAIRGVVIGFGDNPNVMTHPDTPNRDYLPISTAAYVLVIDDPYVIFEVQEDNVANDLTADMVGLNLNINTAADGSTTTGKSSTELDSSDTGSTGQCKLLGVSNRDDNALGTYCKWDVLIAEHEMSTALGTGV